MRSFATSLLLSALLLGVGCSEQSDQQVIADRRGNASITSPSDRADQPSGSTRQRPATTAPGAQPTTSVETVVTASTQPTTSLASRSDASVTLLDAVYGCGPTDAVVVRFLASASEPIEVRAELLVADQAYGSRDGITLSNVPRAFEVDIDLTTEAYEVGTGELRISSSDHDKVLAVAPVVLRLSHSGGCG